MRENIRVVVVTKKQWNYETKDCTLIYWSSLVCSHSPMNNVCHNNSGERRAGEVSLCMYVKAYEPSNKKQRITFFQY